ncbi:alpha/beta hydrolase [Pseudonocardia sp.]|uniref:alpha/beta hydrolase n=1 Tax=Pseudonocardia sp. TaxID=60912 RepID=UPI003D1008E1
MILAEDRDTVLVGHSYGGMVITAAAVDVPTVRHLVYICAFMLDEGDSLLGAVDGDRLDWLDTDLDRGVTRVTKPGPTFYADLPADLVEAYSGRLTTQTTASFVQPLTGAAWRTVGSTYLTCSRDRAIPAVAQRAMAARATHRHEIDSSHTPMASRPQAVADVITAAARSGSSRP